MIRRIFLRDAAAVVGTVLTLGILVFAVVGPWISPHDPVQVDMVSRLLPPSREYWLGTDELGRDIFTRVAYGARYSLGTGVAVIGLATVIGYVVGGVSGYAGGRFDEIVMRACDLVMAFPPMILAMAIAFAMGGGLVSTVIALASVWWASYARLVRGMVLQIKQNLFVEAAHAVATPTWLVIARHILPHTLPAVNARVTVDIGAAIVSAAGLSFIGLGAQQPTPEWGFMISNSRLYIMNAWWYALFPGLAIFAAVLGISLLGDALQDALDPRLRGRSPILARERRPREGESAT